MGSSGKTKRAGASGSSSSSSALPTTLSGFTVLPIAYSASATHVIYARAHSAPKSKNAKGKQKEELPEGRTLFLVNVPPDATERELTVLFKSCGTVEKVVFSTGGKSGTQEEQADDEGESSDEGEEEDGASGEDEGEGSSSEEDEEGNARPRKKRKISKPEGHTAYVVFLDASSLARALKPPQKPYAWPIDSETPLGIAHYTALYAALRPPLDLVRAHADSWMEAFEHEQAKKRQESKYRKGEAIVDEDGFTLVTRGGAYGKTLGGGVGVASKRFLNEQGGAEDAAGTGGKRNRKKKDKKEKDGFYAFQIHEKKRKEIIDLKKKFEEDRAKIEKLKQSRKFKPY